MIDNDRLIVIRTLTNLGIKVICSLMGLILFGVIIYKIIVSNCSLQENLPWIVLEGILTATLYKMYAHYFPPTKHDPNTTDA